MAWVGFLLGALNSFGRNLLPDVRKLSSMKWARKRMLGISIVYIMGLNDYTYTTAFLSGRLSLEVDANTTPLMDLDVLRLVGTLTEEILVKTGSEAGET